MRVIVLILGVIGALGAGYLGQKWYTDSNSDQVKMARELHKKLKEMAGSNNAAMTEMDAKMAELDGLVTCSYVLMAGAAVGLVVSALVALGGINPKLAGLVLILAGAAPAIFAPKALVFSGALILAGLFALGVKGSAKKSTVVMD